MRLVSGKTELVYPRVNGYLKISTEKLSQCLAGIGLAHQ